MQIFIYILHSSIERAKEKERVGREGEREKGSDKEAKKERKKRE